MDVPKIDELSMPSPEEQKEFYAALGKAITSWAELEDFLFEITVSILGCSRDLAAIVFYRTPTIDARVTLTSDLIHAFFPQHEPGKHPEPRMKRWKELQAEIKDNLPIRNRLAHHPVGPVVELWVSEDRADHKVEIRQASHISLGEQFRKRDASPALGIDEIRAHTATVMRLANELRNFRHMEFPARRQASDALEALQNLRPSLNARREATPAPPPRPSRK